MQGLNWTALQLPFAAGLQQKADDRARNPPYLDLAYDVQFDELGGLQTRKPFGSAFGNIVGGGTLSTARRLYANGDELIAFDKDSIYSWNAQLAKFVLRGTHLAVKVDEQPVFQDTGEQRQCDRAELNNTIVYAWAEPTGSYFGGQVRVAAVDKTTGSVVLAPTTMVDAAGAQMPRLIALDTKILLVYITAGSQVCRYKLLDTSDLSTGVTGGFTALLQSDATQPMFDAVKIPGADAAIVVVKDNSSPTKYAIFNVTTSGKTSSAKSRTADGPIGVSVTPDGTFAQVVRWDDVNIKGDLITVSTLVDTAHVNVTIGTTTGAGANNIACAHRSVLDGGQYRCYVFWDEDESESGANPFTSSSNWIDPTGAIGTAAGFVRRLGIASRAFDYDGRIYLWTVFGGENGAALQDTFFLYRDDAFLVAKAALSRAGGLLPAVGSPRYPRPLPGVQLVSGSTGFAWCGTERRVFVTAAGDTGYADRGPRDIVFTFDSNEARRCVRLGQTLYVACGEGILQFDGTQLVELGFHEFPWYLAVTGTTGSIEDGTYTYKSTYRWNNTKGEVDRSTTADLPTHTISGGPAGAHLNGPNLYVTHKTTNPPAIELWRTVKNPPEDAPFYLVSSKDPSVTANPNRYVANNPASDSFTTCNDALADASITSFETNPEVGGVIEGIAPPAASIIIATDVRLFLAGVAGDPDRVWYSKQRSDGEVAAFNDALVILIPPIGGDITALALLNETLIVFRETAVYALPGDGFDNTGGGQNYGPPRLLSADVGAVNHESVAFTPAGVIFKSNKGWYLLNRGWTVTFIGEAVSDYDSETPLAVHLVEAQHQVRILTGSRMLVFDYLANQWAEWTISNGLHATIWQGTYHYLTATGPRAEQATYSSLTYGLDVRTAWIKPADLQGACRIRRALVLGELRSSDVTHLRIRASYNYDDTVVDDVYWPISPTAVGGPLQAKFGPSRQQCEAFKLRITPITRVTLLDDDGNPLNTDSPPTGEAIKLTGLGLEVGAQQGLYRRLAAAQKT